MKYKITSTQQVIIADQAFMDAHHAGNYKLLADDVASTVDPCQWLIDIGQFFDRFGAAKMAVLTSTDSGVKAILQDIQVRKWIDLQRADVISSLAYVGSVVPSVTGPLQTAILTTPVTAAENLALRRLYFS